MHLFTQTAHSRHAIDIDYLSSIHFIVNCRREKKKIVIAVFLFQYYVPTFAYLRSSYLGFHFFFYRTEERKEID